MPERKYYFSTVGWAKPLTREKWLDEVGHGKLVQPPDWWLISYRKEHDLTTQAATRVWQGYEPARRYVIWDQAPAIDFLARGYIR